MEGASGHFRSEIFREGGRGEGGGLSKHSFGVFGVWGLGFRVWVCGLGFRVWGLGFKDWGLGFRVYGCFGLMGAREALKQRALYGMVRRGPFFGVQVEFEGNLPPQTQIPKPQTSNPKPQTRNRKLWP